jgi:diguanylate cyclase (GGDEF)-like protein
MIDLSRINVDSTIADLPYHLFQVFSETKASVIAERFEYDSEVSAVIVVDEEGLIINMISRLKFLERMSKPFALELFINRPIRKIIPFITTRPTRLSASTKVNEAARIILNRPDSIALEPIIAIAQDGLRILECNTIFLAQSKILSLVNKKLEQTLSALEHSQHELKAINAQLTEEITERKRIEEKLSYNALHDGLTGLPNRVLFMNRLEQAFKHYQRSRDRLFGIMFIDLDRFKLVNDTLGHGFGDLLLIQVSNRLGRCLRTIDTVARLGGDEFAVLLDEISDLKQAEICAMRIESDLSTPFNLNGNKVSIGASIGIAIISPQYKLSEELLRDADIAMYQAKRQGDSGYHIFPINLANSQVVNNQSVNSTNY